MDFLDILFRWIHVGAAIVMLGGSIFNLLVIIPASSDLSATDRDAMRARMSGRWRKIVMFSILLLIISGFYNYLAVANPKYQGTDTKKLYSILMGVKILLAFAVFFLASALSGRAAAFDSLRRNSHKWLTLTILLGLIIVAVAGYLKVAVPPGSAAAVAPISGL